MKSRFLLLWLVLLAAFNFLFWNEAPGLNMLLFAVLAMTALFLRYPHAWRRRTVLLSGIGTLLSAAMIPIYGAGWCIFAMIISLAVFAVFFMAPQFRSVSGALLEFSLNIFTWPFLAARRRAISTESKWQRRSWFFTKVVLLPLLVTLLFFLLYLWGNPHFAAKFEGIFKVVRKFFRDFSFGHFCFIVGGGFLCGALLLLNHSGLQHYEQGADGVVRRKRKPAFPPGMLALRNEMKTGAIMLLLLNVLLFFVNGLDISRVWYRFIVPENFSLKDFVHEGTWVLIASIFLSMIVLLWVFRGNMHFYSKNIWLKRLAYLWIAQNIVLALSLFKRNYEYINFHGLAYGRIVVIAFLLLVIFGLVTFLIKIRKDRSVFFLNRVNSWAAYVLIIAASFMNWDKVIVNYNLHHWNKGEIDIDFYLRVHPSAFPLIYENRELVYAQIDEHRNNEVIWVYHLDDFWKVLNAKRSAYWQENCGPKNWPSWNYSRFQATDWMDIH